MEVTTVTGVQAPKQRGLFFAFPLMLALACVLLSGYPSASAVPIRAGSITALKGTATVARGGSLHRASLKMRVFVGDKLRTASHSRLTVTLRDGSRLMLAESSTFVIAQAGARASKLKSVIDLLDGSLRAAVKYTGGRTFEVRTPNAIAGVRGTNFVTKFVAGTPCPGFPNCLRYTDVGVYKGIVEVSNPTSKKPATVRVGGGYETTVPCEMPPASPSPLGMGKLTAPTYR